MKIVLSVLSVMAGLIVGSFINMQLLNLGMKLIPSPTGEGANSIDVVKANIHLFQPIHYVFPYLAHALGTLIGAFATTLIAPTKKFTHAIVLGMLFLIAGIINVVMLPNAAIWFSILDLVTAYIPMAVVGYKLALLINKR
jgi:hypothetical protein